MIPSPLCLGLARAALLLAALLFHSSAFAMSHLIYFGTYTRAPGNSQGIYSVRLDDDTGALTTPILAATAANPAWITFSPDKKHLYTLHASKAQAIGFVVDAAGGKLTPLAVPTADAVAAPSHLAVDATGRMLLAANYADGYLSSMAIRPDGTLGEPSSIPHSGKSVHARQDKPHVHSVTPSPDNRFVIVCDLGLDKIFTYAMDPAGAKVTPANPPFVATEPGSGPRHFKFGTDGRHAYAINEISSTVTAYDYDKANGALTPRQTISTLPANFKGATTTAEVRVHPNGKFVYGSNRGHDSIAVFAANPSTGLLTRVEVVSSGGKVPRNFAISPNGKWLVCAHQDSNNVTVFRINQENGRLEKTAHTATVPMAVCVLFYD
jgi:6-phosphogluconolactonase